MTLNSIRDIYVLSEQYHRETANSILSRNGIRSFEEFYQRRNIIGQLVFEELRKRGYNLTSRRTLELFSNIYDSIGQNFSTYIIDHNTSSLRENHGNNLISEFDKNSVYLNNGELSINSTEIFRGVDRTYHIDHRMDPNIFRYFAIFNPRNNEELRMMRELLNSNYICITGFFGDINDLDIRRHQTDINILENNTDGVIIPNINVDNGYAYILTNRETR